MSRWPARQPSDGLLIENTTYRHQSFSPYALGPAEFTACRFEHCEFGAADLSALEFIDCTFSDCNLSLATLKQTGLKGVTFENCQLRGINFSEASNFLFGVSFRNCWLDYSIFYQKKLRKTCFLACSLLKTDFEQADLTESVFDDSDLTDAVFFRTNLQKADFRAARNFRIDPTANSIRKAKFSVSGLVGLLAQYDLTIEPDIC